MLVDLVLSYVWWRWEYVVLLDLVPPRTAINFTRRALLLASNFRKFHTQVLYHPTLVRAAGRSPSVMVRSSTFRIFIKLICLSHCPSQREICLFELLCIYFNGSCAAVVDLFVQRMNDTLDTVRMLLAPYDSIHRARFFSECDDWDIVTSRAFNRYDIKSELELRLDSTHDMEHLVATCCVTTNRGTIRCVANHALVSLAISKGKWDTLSSSQCLGIAELDLWHEDGARHMCPIVVHRFLQRFSWQLWSAAVTLLLSITLTDAIGKFAFYAFFLLFSLGFLLMRNFGWLHKLSLRQMDRTQQAVVFARRSHGRSFFAVIDAHFTTPFGPYGSKRLWKAIAFPVDSETTVSTK